MSLSDLDDDSPCTGSNNTVSPDFEGIRQEIATPWARLYPAVTYLNAVDLLKPSFKLGRHEQCDVNIVKTELPKNYRTNISKIHFVINKEGALVTLYDKSKNGTFVNGELIGNGSSYLLHNNDQIAIGYKSLTVYVFKLAHCEEDFLPPELAKKYVVARVLGKGASGEVRLVFEKSTRKPFAVKRIIKIEDKSSMIHKMNHPRKVENEIKILQSLSHLCTVAVKEIVNLEQCVFIVLEYMEGGDLSNRIISNVPFPESAVKLVFYQIVLAVQYLHSEKITHRDLKPENVLLKSDHYKTLVKVSDFGLSKISNEATALRTQCGTLNYLAPEVIDPKYTNYDNKVDVWSMGVLLYYMLSRELPFKSQETVKLMRLISRGEYDMPEENWRLISSDAKDLVRRMLMIKPSERISVDEIFDHPWILSDEVMQRDVVSLLLNCKQDLESSFSSTDERPCKKARV